ncbi:MAG: hypothetical protein ISR58_13045 [Anaerolineales bacterium]|nr:hypothetical protein [Chloroflexota bacterium]MBL6982103.1 hypothetical protein [Anaerolineales bacterium]
MTQFVKYLFVGLGFATVVEVINMGILQGNWTGMIATLLIAYSIFIAFSYFLQKRFGVSAKKLVVAYIIMGFIGLILIEWILIGTPLNSSQSLLSIFIFQFGIFNYWATVGFAPRLFLDHREFVKPIKKKFLRFYFIWFVCVYVLGLLLLGDHIRFVFMQVFSAAGHIILVWFYFLYFKKIAITEGEQ